MIEGLPYDVINKVPLTRFDGLKDSKLYLVHTMSEWERFYDLLMQQKIVACDTETSGFHYFKGDRIVGMSFGWGNTHFYVPVRHEDSCLEGKQIRQLSMDDIRDDLRVFFSRQDIYTIWHHWKFDAHFYRADGIEILTPHHDTLHLWQFFDENAPAALKKIASGWKDKDTGIAHEGLVGPDAATWEKDLSKWRGQEAVARRKNYRNALKKRAEELSLEIEHQDKNKNELKKWIAANEMQDHQFKDATKHDVHYGFVPIEMMTKYAATDTYLTWVVYKHVTENMQMDKKLLRLYNNELELSKALLEAEDHGVKIDRPYLVQLRKDLEEEIDELTEIILEELGPINLNSPKQLGDALLLAGVPLEKKTSSGNYSTEAKILKKLQSEYTVIKNILNRRKLTKLKDTYVIGILDKLTEDDILHCSFNQNVSTGRMSSSNPNLQNIPGGDDRIRRAFISLGEDYYYVFADYSQVEVRLTAHYSQDPVLLDAYAKGQDIHTRTMCEMFGYGYERAIDILDDEDHPMYKELKMLRTIAKRINFGIIYGVGAPGLSEQIPRPDQFKNLSEKRWIKVCQDYIDNYLRKYLGVKRFINAANREIRKKAEVFNWFGRPRRLPHAHADKILGKDKYWMVGRAQRQGTNFLIQGTAADVFKIAVVRVYKLFKEEAKLSKIVNYVHDEIQAYIHKDELHLLNKMRKLMEDFDFIVPITVDFAWSKTCWADYKELK